MNIKSFLDSTYLKTAEQAGISDVENKKLIINCIQEAIDEIDHEEVLHLIVLPNFFPGFPLLEDGFNDVE